MYILIINCWEQKCSLLFSFKKVFFYTKPVYLHLVVKTSSPLTLILLRSWARAESACFFRCFPYGPGPESGASAESVCRAWDLELRVIRVTGGWGPFFWQLDLDLFITTPVDSGEKKRKEKSFSLREKSIIVQMSDIRTKCFYCRK